MVFKMRIYIFFRALFEADGLDAINKENGTIPTIAQACQQQNSGFLLFENVPMLFCKIADLLSSKGTVSWYWAMMFFLGLNSTLKGIDMYIKYSTVK